jgi:hypothetical protein
MFCIFPLVGGMLGMEGLRGNRPDRKCCKIASVVFTHENFTYFKATDVLLNVSSNVSYLNASSSSLVMLVRSGLEYTR